MSMGYVAHRHKMADRTVSAVHDSHGFLLCTISRPSCQMIYS